MSLAVATASHGARDAHPILQFFADGDSAAEVTSGRFYRLWWLGAGMSGKACAVLDLDLFGNGRIVVGKARRRASPESLIHEAAVMHHIQDGGRRHRNVVQYFGKLVVQHGCPQMHEAALPKSYSGDSTGIPPSAEGTELSSTDATSARRLSDGTDDGKVTTGPDDTESAYLLFEYCEGGTLKEFVERLASEKDHVRR